MTVTGTPMRTPGPSVPRRRCPIRSTLGAVLLLAACDAFEEERCPDLTEEVSVVGLERVVGQEREAPTIYGPSRLYRFPPEDQAVAASELALMTVSGVLRARTYRERPAYTTRLSCIGPVTRTTNDIEAIRITSDAPWRRGLPAGAPLEQLARVAADQGPSNETLPLAQYNAERRNAPLTASLRLEAPDAERTHRFSITYEMSDGNVYLATSEPVTVTPARDLSNLDGTAWILESYRSAASGSSVPVADEDLSGLEFQGFPDDPLLSITARPPGTSVCGYRGRREPGGFSLFADGDIDGTAAARGCAMAPLDDTPIARFFDAFFVAGLFAHEVDGAFMTLASPTGATMRLRAVL